MGLRRDGRQVYLDAHLAQVLLEQGDVAGARGARASSAPDRRSDALRFVLNAELRLLVAEGR